MQIHVTRKVNVFIRFKYFLIYMKIYNIIETNKLVAPQKSSLVSWFRIF